MSQNEEWLTQKQLGEALGVLTRHIGRLTKEGVLPCIRVGARSPRYTLDRVVAALEESTGIPLELEKK